MRVAVWFLATSFSCVCAAAPHDPQVALSVDFQDCLAGRQQTFFTLDFLPDGTVTFEGKDEIREKGARSAHISPRRAQRLIHTAKIAASPDAPQAETSPSRQRPLFCLNVKVIDGHATLTSNVSPEDHAGKRLHSQILSYVDLQSWVCPTRGWAPEVMARCAPSIISFSYRERESCYTSHSVRLWRDGQVYYTAALVGSDRYFKIDPTMVNRLFEIGWRSEGGPIFAGMQHDHRKRHFQNTSTLIAYKQTLTELANVTWQPLPVSDECRLDRQDFPQGTLSLYR
jgi:hypothetical protein